MEPSQVGEAITSVAGSITLVAGIIAVIAGAATRDWLIGFIGVAGIVVSFFALS